MRGRKLMDQKANSVADMAFVLGRLEGNGEMGTEKEKGERIGLQGEGTGALVEVLWRDVLDAEFAETWSGNVVHGVLEQRARKPENIPVEEVSMEEGQTLEKLEPVEEEGKKPEKLTL
jgi:hypothetical protein